MPPTRVHAGDEFAEVRRHRTDHVVHRRHDHDRVAHRLRIDEHACVVVPLHDDARDAGTPRGRDRREEHRVVLGDGGDDAGEAPGGSADSSRLSP
jgi:DNA-binding transcriptional LysR family regulator